MEEREPENASKPTVLQALFCMPFGMRHPDAFVGMCSGAAAFVAGASDADADAFLNGTILGILLHPAATAQMRERGLAAIVGLGPSAPKTHKTNASWSWRGALLTP